MMGPASLFAPTVDLQDVLRGWYPPRNTNAPGHFGDPPLPTKKSWVPLVISNITGGVVLIWIGNVVPLKTIPSNVHGSITLNNGIERMNKCHFKMDTRLCNMDNQTDSNDATWIWINPTILVIRWFPNYTDNTLKSPMISLWDMHCGKCLTSFWNLDLHVHLVRR